MGEECEVCIEWRKHLYWNYFEPTKVHFFVKLLLHGFHQTLGIPGKCVSNFREKLSETVVLKDQRDNTWNVRLRETEDELFFEEGWREFVRDNSLAENDLLVFRYDDGNDSCLHVLIFNQTGCEKEAKGDDDYGGKTSQPSRSDHVDLSKSKERVVVVEKEIKIREEPERRPVTQARDIAFQSAQATSTPFHGDESQEDDLVSSEGFSTKRQSKENPVRITHASSPPPTTTTTTIKRVTRNRNSLDKVGNDKDDRDDHLKTSSQLRHQFSHIAFTESKESVVERETITKAKHDTVQCHIDARQTYKVYFESRRRRVTLAEINRAFQLALAATSTKPNFITVMKPTHVYKRFFLTIPHELARSCVPETIKVAILRVPRTAKLWIVGLIHTEFNSGLSGGWADFVMDNNLEEGDACLFELSTGGDEQKQIDNSITIDVSIYRVVEELEPLIVVRVPQSMEGKKPKK